MEVAATVTDKGKRGGNRKATKVQESDFDVFVPEQHLVTTIHGETVRVPKISFKKERLISKLINSLLGGLAKSGALTGFDVGEETDLGKIAEMRNDMLANMLGLVFEGAPEKLGEAASILLSDDPEQPNRDMEWVDNNLTSDEIINLVLPFLASRRDKIAAVVQVHSARLKALAETVTATLQ